MNDVVFGLELGVECVIVEDWVAEVEDGGFGDDAVSVGTARRADVVGHFVGGISGGAHNGHKMKKVKN